MSAFIYRIDEGLQFCIKAIQDYAYSGFGGRGGKHGDIFWDNESYAIKQYLKMAAEHRKVIVIPLLNIPAAFVTIRTLPKWSRVKYLFLAQ